MTRIIFLGIFLIFLFVGVAMAVGVRIHPEYVPEYIEALKEGPLYRFELASGRIIDGHLQVEAEDYIDVRSEEAVLRISKSQIRKIGSLATKKKSFANFDALKQKFHYKPFITKDKKDSLLGIAKKEMGSIVGGGPTGFSTMSGGSSSADTSITSVIKTAQEALSSDKIAQLGKSLS